MTLMTKEVVEKLSKEVKRAVVKEYLQTTYYWTVGSFSFLVGLLLGIIIK